MARSFERLASGLRINSAKDDAAGLSISARMDQRRRAIDQARRNTQDGVSVAQTAEASLSEISALLIRLRELAVQAANDSNSTTDRMALHRESEELIDALNQIAKSAEFNGRKLLDGSQTKFNFQTGASKSNDATIAVELEAAHASALGKLAIYEKEVGDNWAGEGVVVTFNGVEPPDARSFVDDLDDDATINRQLSSATAKARQINAMNIGIHAEAKEATAFAAITQAATSNYSLRLNGVLIFSASKESSVDDLIGQINARTKDTGVVAEKKGAGISLSTPDGRNMHIQSSRLEFLAAGTWKSGKLVLISDEKIEISGSGGAYPPWGHGVFFSGAYMPYTVALDSLGLSSGIDLRTRAGAQLSIMRYDTAIDKVLAMRADLGSLQQRFEFTASNLGQSSNALQEAGSRIRDVDFALETANLTRLQVLQSAANSIRAQAHVTPRLALQLLA